jgi:hypothetical protein
MTGLAEGRQVRIGEREVWRGARVLLVMHFHRLRDEASSLAVLTEWAPVK